MQQVKRMSCLRVANGSRNTAAALARRLVQPTRVFSIQTWAFCQIDYHLATPGVAATAKREHIYLEQRFSDHAPVMIDYDFKL